MSTRTTAKVTDRVRCAIYTRKSSEEGLEQGFNSLHAQREACEAYVLSQAGEGWTVSGELYDDGGYSGGTLERPALQRLLQDIQARRIDIVVLYKIDRLTRSLANFARLVEVFEAGGASFVSVTQAFNTTTSMGRLTLNMLLSFAQFEREVTGERIRDKIAASKAKGMWMGGLPPLGYDPHGRTLKIVEEEARTVRQIFARYLELGSVATLRDELHRQGVRSKCGVSRSTGKPYGGCVLARGALYHLLSNRIYLGEIVHKDQTHPGQHLPIVEPEVFAEVQAKLAENGGHKRRARQHLPALLPTAPLAGLIRDDRGGAMSPATARARSGHYRYYVSSAVQTGRRAEAGSLVRAPAKALEALVLDRLGHLTGALEPHSWSQARALLIEVRASRYEVALTLDRTRIAVDRATLQLRCARLPSTDRLEEDGDRLILTCQTRIQRRGGGKVVVGPNGAPAVDRTPVDFALLRALVRAEAWKASLLSGEAATLAVIAEREGVRPAYARRLLRLAFLSPALKRAIVQGRTYTGLTLERMREDGVPDLWIDQERQVLN